MNTLFDGDNTNIMKCRLNNIIFFVEWIVGPRLYNYRQEWRHEFEGATILKSMH